MKTTELEELINQNPLSADNIVMETQLKSILAIGGRERFYVVNYQDEFFLAIGFEHIPSQLWYVVTQRDKSRPKMFKDLTRLNTLIKRASTNGYQVFFLHKDIQDFPLFVA